MRLETVLEILMYALLASMFAYGLHETWPACETAQECADMEQP